jgi:hypothetical protein
MYNNQATTRSSTVYSISRSKQLVSVVVFTLVLVALLFLALCDSPRTGIAAPREADSNSKTETLLSTTELTPQLYLPSIFRSFTTPAYRLGYCSLNGSINQYPPIGQLRAGWYVNFRVQATPARPQMMEYVQTVRIHQLTQCLEDSGDYLRDRTACPYVQKNGNYTYTLESPDTRADIVSIAQANPGTLWLIGNEMDRYDCGGVNPYNPEMVGDPKTCHQDEMLPELYAQAYHEFYYLIKGADPTAQVAIGGIIQATPSRLEYLTKAWNEYYVRYGTNMPVDVWNVHNFIFKERCDDFGADIPPGCTNAVCTKNEAGEICYGTIYSDNKHNSLQVFDQQIRAFRQWMKARGQQNKPLIVSEYGIVYYHVQGMEDPNVVESFMLATFDYFMNTKDCSLGYPADECRLVQRWAWYSLDDNDPDINAYSYLINPDTLQMTSLGEAFANYAQDHSEGP